MIKKEKIDAIKSSGCFDEEWYRNKYINKISNTDLIVDYLTHWKTKKRNPNPFFDNDFYISQFDNFDKHENPLIHYCTIGWKKFKNPSKDFSSWWYTVKYISEKYSQNPLTHFLSNKCNNKTTLNETDKLSVTEKTQYNTKSIKIFESIAPNSELAICIAKANYDLLQFDVADMFAVKACELAPKEIEPKVQLARILMKRNNGWLRLISITEEILSKQSIKEVHFIRARALHKLERQPEAIKHYKESLADKQKVDPESLYYLASCLEETGQKQESEKYYKLALNNTTGVDQSLGFGILHEKKGLWEKAENEYKKEIELGNKNPNIYIRHGLMLDYRYQWKKARNSYLKAIKLGSQAQDVLLKIGITYEQQEKYDAAANYYEKAISKSKEHNNEYNYRLGYALWKLKRYKEACNAWEKSLIPHVLENNPWTAMENPQKNINNNRLLPQNLYLIGRALLQSNDLKNAIRAFKEATSRRNTHSENDYYYLGKCYKKIGLYEKACDAFRQTRISSTAQTIPEESIQFDKKQIYAEYLESLRVNKNIILYESFHGASISCNPLGIFKYLLTQQEHKKKKHIWVINSTYDIPEELSSLSNVIFVKHGSELYLRYLATAGYLINNNTFPAYFIRRSGQKYLNTWHGTPLKTLGIDIPQKPFEHKNVLRNILQCTHIIYPNKHTLEKFLASYQAQDIYTAKTSFTGYPRIDMMINATQEKKENIKKKLKINNGLPNILYAPTWRGELSSPHVDISKITDLITELSSVPANLIISAHHLVNEKIKNINSEVNLIDASIDTTETLSIVDLLITDYSSIMFDFLPQEKPILLYTYDLHSYKQNRGLYLPVEDLPFYKCANAKNIAKKVQDEIKTKQNYNKKHNDIITAFCPMEDGNSSKRATEFLFKDKGSDIKNVNKKTKILFYAGSFLSNGITSSFLRLAAELNKEKYSISLALDPWLMESYPQRMQKFYELPEKINILGRVSFPIANKEEQYLVTVFKNPEDAPCKKIKTKVERYYTREYNRLYGNTFNVVLDFNGYSYFWAALLSIGAKNSCSSAMWLHNDMMNEVNTKHPYLSHTLKLGNYFDMLVSVSKDINITNTKNISKAYNIDDGKFVYARNIIDPSHIHKKSLAKNDKHIDDWCEDSIVFYAAGRLSHEKGYETLIKAFHIACLKYDNIKLIIAGEGPERHLLEHLISQLNLSDKIKLIGYISNPYPLFKKANAFILSSKYEGQGIVVLEALTLDCPVISTNIDGPREIINEYGGILIEHSINGIYEGIEKHMKGYSKQPTFNSKDYVKEATNEFIAVITKLQQISSHKTKEDKLNDLHSKSIPGKHY